MIEGILMAETLREKVVKVLESDLSSYEIGHLSGISTSIISRLRSGHAHLDRLGLLSAERIASVMEPPVKKHVKRKD